MKIGLISHCPSPHQKPLLDSIHAIPGIDLLVGYAFTTTKGRQWGNAIAEAPHVFLSSVPGRRPVKRWGTWIKDADRDVWVMSAGYPYFRTQCLARALQRSGRPWAFFAEPPRPSAGLREAGRMLLLRNLLSRCDGVIGNGVESARRYAMLLGDQRPVTSVPYYIPLDEWLAIPRTNPSLQGGPVKFLLLAQLVHRKGIDLLIQAGSMLPKDGWRVDIYGDGPERERLQNAITAGKLPITLHPPVPFAERTGVFRDADCFVFPSRWDGWGMAPVEALAAGLPVIATDHTMSAHDFIRDGVNGWMVPVTADAIASAMAGVIRARDRLPAMSVAARESVAHYRSSEGASELVQFCKVLCHRNAA